ncbi:MAG: hypothetical protein WDN24_22160 [Sphingomonas sp.]
MTGRSRVNTVIVPGLSIESIGQLHTIQAPALEARYLGAAGAARHRYAAGSHDPDRFRDRADDREQERAEAAQRAAGLRRDRRARAQPARPADRHRRLFRGASACRWCSTPARR